MVSQDQDATFESISYPEMATNPWDSGVAMDNDVSMGGTSSTSIPDETGQLILKETQTILREFRDFRISLNDKNDLDRTKSVLEFKE